MSGLTERVVERIRFFFHRKLWSFILSTVKFVVVIPARYGSTRFPGKPLALIAGQTLIQRVIQRCQGSKAAAEVIVATDDSRIAAVAGKFARVEMTRDDHPSGTDRIAEVASRVPADGYVNVQGDEPLMDPVVIDAVVRALEGRAMSTAATALREVSELENPNIVKVVTTTAGRAMYFSRRTIPFLRDQAGKRPEEQMAAFPFLKHLGIYGYTGETLRRLVRLPPSPLEQAEKLEQLRALEAGIEIGVATVQHESVGVDVPSDIARVERLLAG